MTIMRITEFIRKYGFSTVTGTATLVSYKNQLYTHKEMLKAAELEKNQLQTELHALDSAVSTRWNTLQIKASTVKEIEDKISIIDGKLNTINQKLAGENFTSYETKANLDYMKGEYIKDKTNLVELKHEAYSEITKYIHDLEKSSTFDWAWDLIEQYKEFTLTLSLEQLVALYNLIGYFMIWSALSSICLILVGDSIIKKLNLEVKLPKLARILQTRARLTKAYLKFYVFLLFILIFINVSVNIYMFVIAF